MTGQRSLFDTNKDRFDRAESQKEKEKGMSAAEIARAELLEIARDAARAIAARRPDRCCTADDVQKFLVELGKKPEDLGSAAGSIFRGKNWEFTGRWTKSDRVSNHRSDLRIWRLK